MRTKALLVGAIIGAASLASSMAQVYSVNIVGYINVPIKPGWNLIANQLNNSAGNTVAALMPAPAYALSVYTYIAAAQSYDNSNYDTDFQEWDKPGLAINPGAGAFILNSGPEWTLTLVGEVQTGTSTIDLVQGWQLVAPVVPQDGHLQNDLGYTPSPGGDSVYFYDAPSQAYINANYDGDFMEWDRAPMCTVGQGFFLLRTSTGQWTRTFNVNN
jgi:hypothetical protein